MIVGLLVGALLLAVGVEDHLALFAMSSWVEVEGLECKAWVPERQLALVALRDTLVYS